MQPAKRVLVKTMNILFKIVQQKKKLFNKNTGETLGYLSQSGKRQSGSKIRRLEIETNLTEL